jgi:putative ABC transport system permease protein
MMDTLWQDLQYGVRTMRKAPGVAAIAVLTLALGIGATTTMFTVINAVLLKPLDYHEPERLVRISGGATLARYESIREARSLSGVGAFLVVTENAALAGSTGPEPLKGTRVSTNFLTVLGVSPLLGRSFLPSEETPGSAVAMISAGLWRRRFGGDAGVVGTTIRLDAAPCTIIGVLPAGFSFPFADMDIWRPLQPATIPLQTRLHSPLLSVVGRLGPGVSLSQATSEMDLINRRYVRTHPGMLDAKLDRPESLVLLRDQLVRNVRSFLWMLFGAVSFVLLIACANVAGLLLARATARSREFAIRAALGAGRGRLIRQLLAESLLLAAAGGAFGVLLADLGVRAIRVLPGFELPRVQAVEVDGVVLAFAIALSVLTTLLFGLAPSLSASKPDLGPVMKGAGGGSQKSSGIWRSPRGLLVTGQVALSTVLLIGAALLIESLSHLRDVDMGFQPAHLLTMQVTLSPVRYDTTVKQAAFFEDLVRRVESVPGVRSAAITITLPTTGWAGTPVQVVGRPLAKLNERPIAILQNVTPGYFRTLGIALKRGRDFEQRDSVDAPLVTIINERMARRFWPAYPAGEDPVGHFILAGANPTPLQIVGIVSDVRQSGIADEAEAGIYRPRAQTPPMPAMFAIRTEDDSLHVMDAVRRLVAAIDPDQAITAVQTMDDVVEKSEGQRRSITVLLGSFALVGLLLALVGIYGVIAYSVAQRTREVGIRCALGAQSRDVLKLILSQGLGLALVGAILGIAGATALTRTLKSFVFGVSTIDPATFAGVAVLLILVVLAASYIPARRATRIDPATALRSV